jgi:hypothetical protein
LLASPEMSSQGVIIIRSVLMPELQPGRQVHINSATFKGFVTIEKVRFAGSNFGEEWEAVMECEIN